MGLVWSSSGFWLLSSLIKTMDVADPEDMKWRCGSSCLQTISVLNYDQRLCDKDDSVMSDIRL